MFHCFSMQQCLKRQNQTHPSQRFEKIIHEHDNFAGDSRAFFSYACAQTRCRQLGYVWLNKDFCLDMFGQVVCCPNVTNLKENRSFLRFKQKIRCGQGFLMALSHVLTKLSALSGPANNIPARMAKATQLVMRRLPKSSAPLKPLIVNFLPRSSWTNCTMSMAGTMEWNVGDSLQSVNGMSKTVIFWTWASTMAFVVKNITLIPSHQRSASMYSNLSPWTSNCPWIRIPAWYTLRLSEEPFPTTNENEYGTEEFLIWWPFNCADISVSASISWTSETLSVFVKGTPTSNTSGMSGALPQLQFCKASTMATSVKAAAQATDTPRSDTRTASMTASATRTCPILQNIQGCNAIFEHYFEQKACSGGTDCGAGKTHALQSIALRNQRFVIVIAAIAMTDALMVFRNSIRNEYSN